MKRKERKRRGEEGRTRRKKVRGRERRGRGKEGITSQVLHSHRFIEYNSRRSFYGEETYCKSQAEVERTDEEAVGKGLGGGGV